MLGTMFLNNLNRGDFSSVDFNVPVRLMRYYYPINLPRWTSNFSQHDPFCVLSTNCNTLYRRTHNCCNKLIQNSPVNGRKSTWNCCSWSTINLRSKGSHWVESIERARPAFSTLYRQNSMQCTDWNTQPYETSARARNQGKRGENT